MTKNELDDYAFGPPGVFLTHKGGGHLDAVAKAVSRRLKDLFKDRIRVWSDLDIDETEISFWNTARDGYTQDCECAIVFVCQNMLADWNGGCCAIEILTFCNRNRMEGIKLLPVYNKGVNRHVLSKDNNIRETKLHEQPGVDYKENFDDFVQAIITEAGIEQLSREFRGQEFHDWALTICRQIPHEDHGGSNTASGLAALDGTLPNDADEQTKFQRWASKRRRAKLAIGLLEANEIDRLCRAVHYIANLRPSEHQRQILVKALRPLWVPDDIAVAFRDFVTNAHQKNGEGASTAILLTELDYHATVDLISRAYRFNAAYERGRNPLEVKYSSSSRSKFSEKGKINPHGATSDNVQSQPTPSLASISGSGISDRMCVSRMAIREEKITPNQLIERGITRTKPLGAHTLNQIDGKLKNLIVKNRTLNIPSIRSFVILPACIYLAAEEDGSIEEFGGSTFLLQKEGPNLHPGVDDTIPALPKNISALRVAEGEKYVSILSSYFENGDSLEH